jgi:hypothetical protein
VLPVFGGIVVLAAIFAATWGLAAWISRGGAESTTRLAPEVLDMGNVERWAESIDESGPILLPDLDTESGARSFVLDHTGDDPARGWRLYLAYPEGEEPSCIVTQIRDSSRFEDCHGNELGVSELARPTDACPIIENRERLSIGLGERRCRSS